MLYGGLNPVSGGQLEWLILYGAWCWPPFFHPAQLWPLPPSSPVYDMAHQMCQGFDEADQKTDRKKPCSTVGFKAARKETEIPSFYVVDDPELLICKTNAGREKNATMGPKNKPWWSEFIQGQFFSLTPPHIIHSLRHGVCTMKIQHYTIRVTILPVLLYLTTGYIELLKWFLSLAIRIAF